MNVMKQQIREIFTDLKELKHNGIWFSEKRWEGEFKRWYSNGQLFVHCFYNGKDIFKGEYKRWHENGQLFIYCNYKNNKKVGEYKRWWDNGQLLIHNFYRGIIDKYSIIYYQGKNDKRFKGEYKKWNKNGQLVRHIIFNKDGSLKETIV